MGGPGCKRVDQPISIFKDRKSKTNRYGEPVPDYTLGIRHQDELVISRPHTWEIVRVELNGGGGQSLPEQNLRAGLPGRPLWDREEIPSIRGKASLNNPLRLDCLEAALSSLSHPQNSPPQNGA